jgi:Ca2+-binding EF-hand superfamily protein
MIEVPVGRAGLRRAHFSIRIGEYLMIVAAPLLLLMVQAGTPAAKPAPAAPQSITKAAAQARAKSTFELLDANKDGSVDQTEAQSAMVAAAAKRRSAEVTAVFTRADTNKDGSLSKQEYEASLPPLRANAQPWVASNDTDKNGRVTLSEVTAASTAAFDRLDTDHNGVVTAQEARARVAAAAKRK